jgi:hypothetical protein
MKAARDAFECWQSLLGHNPKSHKSTKKPHLAHVQPMAKVAPISTVSKPQESGNQSVENATVKPASEQAAIAPVKVVSPIPPTSDEDCPF